jgi:cytoskeletal protein RodZ
MIKSNLTTILSIVVFFSILTAVGAIYFRMVNLEKRNAELTTALETANNSIKALDVMIKKHNDILEVERGLINEIESAPKEDDADTAPVLLHAIERLR